MLLHFGLRLIGTFWLVGSYPGEEEFAWQVLLNDNSNDITKASIIISDKMTRDKTFIEGSK